MSNMRPQKPLDAVTTRLHTAAVATICCLCRCRARRPTLLSNCSPQPGEGVVASESTICGSHFCSLRAGFLAQARGIITWVIFSPTSLPKHSIMGVTLGQYPLVGVGLHQFLRFWGTHISTNYCHHLFHVEPSSMIFSWTSPHPDNSNEDGRRGLWRLRGATGATDQTRKRILSRSWMARHPYKNDFCGLRAGFLGLARSCRKGCCL